MKPARAPQEDLEVLATTFSRGRRTVAALAGSAVLALLASACTGSSDSGGATDESAGGKDVTITFWHGWSQDNELKAINDNIAAFEKAHPNIHVKAVGNMADDKVNQALRAGGDDAPDVVSSFTTNNVGMFCSTKSFVDLKPLLEKSGIDPAKTFPATMLNYTQHKGNQCTLPLLGDAYGLYYNKKAFAAAGIASPPKTFSEFATDAKLLTQTDGDSYKQLGFMPLYHGYESTTEHYLGQYGATYFGADGKSNIATDPKVAAMLKWQKDMVDQLGGYAKLDKFRSTFGEEFSAKNPFHTGQVAMILDGEWRTASLADSKPDFEWATAPFPVPDDQADTWGRGYQTGTVVGITSSSKKQAASWELVKYLTTDTDAVVSFANAIHNVPSTFAALDSPKLQADANFKTFIDVAKNKNSSTTPPVANGGAYIITLQNLGYDYESGKQSDLAAGLASTAKQIDTDLAQAK